MCNTSFSELKGDVIHITSDERSINWKWDRKSDKIDKRIQFVSIDDIPAIRENTNVVFPEVYENDVLIKHPFEPNTYLNLKDAVNVIKKDKWFKISEIAQKLGAKGFTIEEAKESIDTRRFDASLGLKYKPVKTGLDIKKEDELKEKLGTRVSDEFEGRKIISEKSYKEAIDLANKYNLGSDPEIGSLIRMRDPKNENTVRSRSIHCEMTKELNSALDAAFSLNILPDVFSLDLNVKKIIETKETITLDILFEFPE